MGTLYIVGTPIGNLEDLSPRAARILGQAGLVAAEDTRVTRRLLNHLGIRPKLTSFHQHNYQEKLDLLLRALGEGDVALVTDAGMPGVSDPGSELVARAALEGFAVESVPGPSAVTTALAVSGLPGDAFEFLGFLPRRRKDRQARLRESVSGKTTLVLFEAPHRVRATLADLDQVFGTRTMAVCRELTKMYEEVFRGTAAQALEHFNAPRGEFVIVVAGASEDSDPNQETDPGQLQREIQSFLLGLKDSGVRAKDAVAQASAIYGLPKNRVYQIWLEAGRASD
jgi:16S rRNA (cytidine1402-2'-O)-methyltransferase